MAKIKVTPITKVLFMGSKRLGLKCLMQMHETSPKSVVAVLTMDDRADARSVLMEFEDFCAKNKIPIFLAKDKRESEAAIAQVKPQLCMVVGWYWLISKQALDLVPDGYLGIHNSLLPAYRGGSPLIWAMINGERKIGISLFSFADGMDDGPVWAQASVQVGSKDGIEQVLAGLETKAVGLLKSKYKAILSRGLRPKPQKHAQATYCAQRFPTDGLINWTKKASDVFNFIRAQSQPYPGSFTLMDGKKLIVWRASLLPETYYGTPGQVAFIRDNGVIVVCGDHKAVLLETVSLDSGVQKANEVIRSFKVRF